jgi:hypothetical protein
MHSKKAIWNACLYGSLLLVIGFVFQRSLGEHGLQSVRAEGAQPFTLTLREVIRDDLSKPERVSRDITIAQRSDGLRSELTTHLPGQRGEHRKRLVILQNMRHVNVAESVGMKSTGVPLSNDVVEKVRLSRPVAGGNCMTDGKGQPVFAGYKFAGQEFVGGLLAAKMVQNDPNPIEAWHALALNCEEIQRKIRFEGPIANASELRFVGYSPGEPDPKLFDVSQFKEAAPGEAAIALSRHAGFPAEFLKKLAAQYQKVDERYWQSREAAGIRPQSN